MNLFRIDTENKITVFACSARIEDKTRPMFASEAELAETIADWPMVRLVEIWNTLRGVAPLKRFTSRNIAARRIWRAIQRLDPTSAERPQMPYKESGAVDRESKKAQVLTMLNGPNGATVQEIMILTGWQSHTVRGFVSGTLVKKMQLAVQSFNRSSGERAYRVGSKD